MARRITVTNVKQTFNFSPITNIGNRIEIGETKSGGENIVIAAPQGSVPFITLDYGDVASSTSMVVFTNDTGTQGRIGVGAAAQGLWVENSGSGTHLYLESSNGGDVVVNNSAAAACDFLVNADTKISTLGKGLFVKEGSNATMGVVTLSGGAGTAIVYTTAFTASSRVFAMHQNTSGTLGTVRVTASSNLVSFTLSTATNDTSVVAWWIIQQA